MREGLWCGAPSVLDHGAGGLWALSYTFDVVVLEGAGSPAEINLRHCDVVNMQMARHAGAPVVLVGDIDRGGVFASLVGTWALLDEADRRHLKAFAINKLRETRVLRDRPRPCHMKRECVRRGVPHWGDLEVPEEDSLGWDELAAGRQSGKTAS